MDKLVRTGTGRGGAEGERESSRELSARPLGAEMGYLPGPRLDFFIGPRAYRVACEFRI